MSVTTLGGLSTQLTIIQETKTVASTGTPEPLTASSTFVQSVEIVAQKGQGSANSGNVYLGPSSANGGPARPLEPGEIWAITAPEGQKIDLNDIYVDAATNGDGVTFTAIP